MKTRRAGQTARRALDAGGPPAPEAGRETFEEWVRNRAAPEAGRYRYARPRGLAPWSPHTKTRALLAQIDAVLTEYAEHLPLTARQVFYRLVGAHGYEKTQTAYERLCETLTRARRAGLVPFDAIRDDGVTADEPDGFSGTPEFWRTVECLAGTYRRDRQAGQPVAAELWCEAGGMVPQLATVAHDFGVPVYSSGGFDSLTAKHAAAERVRDRDVLTVILHVGDHDPSGMAVFDSAKEDVAALARDLGAACAVEFRRVAVTPAQIKRHRLPTAPAKKTDRRGDWHGGTVQAEALPPDVLAAEVREAIEAVTDADALAEVKAAEEAERAEVTAAVKRAMRRAGGRR